MKKRVIVGMSGGVDSSTAAAILLKQGYEVIGINIKFSYLTEVSGYGGCGFRGIEDARSVAYKLGIPFYTINYEKEFENKVIKYFCEEYLNGRTPNPCIICNEKIKFSALLNKAKEFSADYIASGHYARIEYDKSSKRWLLKKAFDHEKDQSYFLFSLTQEYLSKILFPLWNYTKTHVRQLAKEFGLQVHNKPTSQEICFIPNNDYRKFIKTQLHTNNFKPGLIVNSEGKPLGKHQGIAFYTIGQRKGIGAHGKPFYVISINKEKNTIVIGQEHELYKDTLIIKDVNWIDRDSLTEPIEVKTRIRYKHCESRSTIFPLTDGRVKIKFHEPQRAITPGQAAVFYDNDTVVGGGWIM